MTTLGEYAKIQGGFAYKSKDFIGASEYRVLKIKNVRFGTIDYSEPAFVPKNIAESTINWKLKEGDILISMTGSGPNAPQSLVGRVARVWKNEPDAWFNQRVGRINLVDNKKIHPDFIFYWLSLPQNQDFLVANSSGSANQANISGKTIESLPTPIVDYEISSAIAKIARELDEKIILNTQINQTLEQIAQAIFKSWFVDFDPVKAKIEALAAGGSADDAELAAMSVISFKALDELSILKASNPEAFNKLAQTAALFPAAMQDSELGEIPEGWEVSEIGNEVIVVGGGTPSTKNTEFWEDGTIHWTTPKDMSGLNCKVLTNTDRKITEAGLKKISSGLLSKNTVLMSSRAPVGYLALAKIPVAINQGYIAMKCEGRLSPEYVLLWCEHNMEEIKQRASGTTFAEISKANFKPIPVIVPTKSIIDTFTVQVSDIYNIVHANVLQSETLSISRDLLLPQLLSGELSDVFKDGE
ncbi:restriction endonuclease subunit S [Vibrio vulnificus]|nr:restriction endonuclease subunit S [Vibrio vulnificus]MBN8085296.1 restriction endonuclease subunit S [Vibrio vulnificus]MBN8128342.1 restriction endonuclease subunit S [Vibrio vulnificus]MBN8155851.1 restriction endonuclease subunit S [Vibrio vulnificus]HAS6073218.1 restriction endonuclease subunit S [Vibrio vulnificus]HDY7827624.1 restriction endonuclease subunit S [Vibrio vulnificus]